MFEQPQGRGRRLRQWFRRPRDANAPQTFPAERQSRQQRELISRDLQQTTPTVPPAESHAITLPLARLVQPSTSDTRFEWEQSVQIPNDVGVFSDANARELMTAVFEAYDWAEAMEDESARSLLRRPAFQERDEQLNELFAEQQRLRPLYAEKLVEAINEHARRDGERITAQVCPMGTQPGEDWPGITLTTAGYLNESLALTRAHEVWARARNDAATALASARQNDPASIDQARDRLERARVEREQAERTPTPSAFGDPIPAPLHWETQIWIPDNEGVFAYPGARDLKARVYAAYTDPSIPFSDFYEDHDRLRRLEQQQEELLPRYVQGLVESINERARGEGKTIRARTTTATELGSKVAWITYTATGYDDLASAKDHATALHNASLDDARWRVYPPCLPDEEEAQATPDLHAESDRELDREHAGEDGPDDGPRELQVGDLRFGATITHFVDGWPFDIDGPIDRDQDGETALTLHLPEAEGEQPGRAEPGSGVNHQHYRSEENSLELTGTEPEFEI